MGTILWALAGLAVVAGLLFLVIFLPIIGLLLAALLLVVVLAAAGAIGAWQMRRRRPARRV